MTQSQKYQDIAKKLAQHHQKHLLAFFAQLTPNQQEALLSQIEGLEWRHIDHWIDQYVKKDFPANVPQDVCPASYYSSNPISDKQKRLYIKAKAHGQELIRSGKIAGFVVAGGQGTRLGFDGPKGAFPATPIKKKVLFQLFAEAIAETNLRYKTRCPFYITTRRMP